MKTATLYYIYDPMCAWCYGFAQALDSLIKNLPNHIQYVKLLGGLAPDSNEPMPVPMQRFIKQNWQRIEATIPGVTFDYTFWETCHPRRSTYPACRAVIAARQQGVELEDKMTDAIQRAYYQQAKNPSDIDTLIQLAIDLGLTASQFKHDLNSADTNNTLLGEIDQARQMNVSSYPSLVLQLNGTLTSIPIDYNKPNAMLDMINHLTHKSAN